MDLSKILTGLTGAVVEAAHDAADKEITVDELIDIIKKGIDGMGLGDQPIINFRKDNDGK